MKGTEAQTTAFDITVYIYRVPHLERGCMFNCVEQCVSLEKVSLDLGVSMTVLVKQQFADYLCAWI